MRALITGYGGFAGSHLAEHLLADTDWQVWGTFLETGSERRRDDGAVRERPADLRHPGEVTALVREARPDVVFHLAGQASVRDSWLDPWGTFEANVRIQINLHQVLEAERGRCRLLVVTSNEVYGAPSSDRLPVDEAAPLSPMNPYAASKLAQDTLAQLYGRSGDVDVVRVRPFTHIGPGQDDRFVASSFARQVAEIESGLREPVLRVGNLAAERDFTDVRDIVRGYRLVAERGEPGGVYNLGTGRAHAIQEVLDYMVGHATCTIAVEPDPALIRPLDVPKTLCDAGRARRELGWAPRIPFERTLQDILDAWRAAVSGGDT